MGMSGKTLPLYARAWRDSATVKLWQGCLGVGTFVGYYSYLHQFLRQIGKGPDEAIAWAKNPANLDAVLDAINLFVTAIQRRYATKQLANAAVRSFFMHNRVALPRDPSLIIRASAPPVERQLTIPHVKELAGVAVQPWRSMILMKWGSLADNQGLVDISNNHAATLVEALEEKTDICKLTMPGRKKRRNLQSFYTFAHPEALSSLREYFERQRGWPNPGDPVWVYETRLHRSKSVKTRGFGQAWLRLLKHVKLIPNAMTHDPGTRYGFGAHNTRDLVISELCTVPGFNIMCADFWAGHEIDPLKYKEFYKTKPWYVEKQYRLAMPYLNMTSSDARHEEKDYGTIKRLEETVQMLSATVMRLERETQTKVVDTMG